MNTYVRRTADMEGIKIERQNPGLRKVRLEVGSTPLNTIITASYPIDNGKLYELPTYGLEMIGTNYFGEKIVKRYEVYRFGVYCNDGSKKDGGGKIGLFVSGHFEEQSHVIKYWEPNYNTQSAQSNEKGAWIIKERFKIHDGPDELPTKEWVIRKFSKYGEFRLFASIGCIEICGNNWGVGGFIQFNRDIIEMTGSTKPYNEALIEIGKKRLITIYYKAAVLPPLLEWNA